MIGGRVDCIARTLHRAGASGKMWSSWTKATCDFAAQSLWGRITLLTFDIRQIQVACASGGP